MGFPPQTFTTSKKQKMPKNPLFPRVIEKATEILPLLFQWYWLCQLYCLTAVIFASRQVILLTLFAVADIWKLISLLPSLRATSLVRWRLFSACRGRHALHLGLIGGSKPTALHLSYIDCVSYIALRQLYLPRQVILLSSLAVEDILSTATHRRWISRP